VLAAAALAAAGAALATLARAPAASLVGPLILSAVAAATGIVPLAVPGLVADAAFVVVGASVGLRFDRESLRHAGRLAPYMAAAVLVLTVICAALGVVLLAALDTDSLTAYLATTPGGISSVLAAAFDSGADLTVVVAVQTLRLMVLALAAPFAARLLRVRGAE
jgi:membrane AbrB-like protein